MTVWVSSFRYNDKVFRVVVNARTGAVAGDRPYSGWKIFLFVPMIVAIIVGIVMLIMALKKKPEPESESLESAVVAPRAPSLAHASVAPDQLAGYRGFTFG